MSGSMNKFCNRFQSTRKLVHAMTFELESLCVFLAERKLKHVEPFHFAFKTNALICLWCIILCKFLNSRIVINEV